MEKEDVLSNELDTAGIEGRTYRWSLSVLEASGFAVSSSSKILDFGCGAGNLVQGLVSAGYNVQGADLAFKCGPFRDSLIAERRLYKIDTNPYRLPFEDSTFDVVLSFEVMEHVMDYGKILREIRRVLKPDGVYLCMFPSRLGLLETHILVPFAGVAGKLPYLLMWSLLGVRAPHQVGVNPFERARENYQFLKEKTNYLKGSEIIRSFRRAGFSNFRWAEELFLTHSPNPRGRTLARIGRHFPIIFRLYSTFWARVVVAH